MSVKSQKIFIFFSERLAWNAAFLQKTKGIFAFLQPEKFFGFFVLNGAARRFMGGAGVGKAATLFDKAARGLAERGDHDVCVKR